MRLEYADGWPKIVESFTTATRAAGPGNICFDWNRSCDDPSVWLLVEAYIDGEAGRFHVESDHVHAAIERMPHVLRDVPEIIQVDAPGMAGRG